MRQAWCSDLRCDGGAKVGKDCPPAMLICAFCGAPLVFARPEHPSALAVDALLDAAGPQRSVSR
jgi:hypothetical protein